ncbi:MAG: hypothetical protein AABX00_06710 [Nanoarchaeota archaeon]
MIRARSKIILFSLIVVLLLASCSKPECEKNTDCVSANKCVAARCADEKCAYTSKENCCGNEAKDKIEDGKPGNSCTCPSDYGKCDGIGKVKSGSRTIDATYAHYYCQNNECILGVETDDKSAQNFLDSINVFYFKASSVLAYTKPFDMSSDYFELTLTLDDVNKDLELPIKLTRINMLYTSPSTKSEQLIAEQQLANSIIRIGQQVFLRVPLNLDYRPQEIEETGSLRYVLDYSYTKRVPNGKNADGSTIYSTEQVREKFTSPTKQVLFVRSEAK